MKKIKNLEAKIPKKTYANPFNENFPLGDLYSQEFFKDEEYEKEMEERKNAKSVVSPMCNRLAPYVIENNKRASEEYKKEVEKRKNATL
jgi:hypothetical protein